MEFAYLDESGDLGALGSKHLILTLMCTRKKKEISRIIRDAKKRLLDHNKSARWLSRKGEIKFYSFPDKELLRRTLKKLADVEMNIYFVVFEKDGTKISPEVKQAILAHLFRHIMRYPERRIEKITADLSFFNKEKINRFILRNYIRQPVTLKDDQGEEINAESGEVIFSKLSDDEFEKVKNELASTIIEIEHYNSRLSDELQALDLISGSIFAFSEYGNNEYISIMGKGRVRIEGGRFRQTKEK